MFDFELGYELKNYIISSKNNAEKLSVLLNEKCLLIIFGNLHLCKSFTFSFLKYAKMNDFLRKVSYTKLYLCCDNSYGTSVNIKNKTRY